MKAARKAAVAVVITEFLVIAGTGTAARASTIPAWSGRPQSSSSASCFSEAYGAIENTCSTPQTWELSVPFDNGGGAANSFGAVVPGELVDIWPTVTPGEPSSVQCLAYSVDSNATASSFVSSGEVEPLIEYTSQAILLPVYVNPLATVTVQCTLGQYASFSSVRWSASTLDVPLIQQEQSQWCTYASMEIILDYLGAGLVRQCDIANKSRGYAGTSHDCCVAANAEGICNEGDDFHFDQWGYNATFTSSPLTFAQLTSEISNLRPIAFQWSWASGGGHAMVVVDVDTVESGDYVTVVDPGASDGDTYAITYDEWVGYAAPDDPHAPPSHTFAGSYYNITKAN